MYVYEGEKSVHPYPQWRKDTTFLRMIKSDSICFELLYYLVGSRGGKFSDLDHVDLVHCIALWIPLHPFKPIFITLLRLDH